MKLIIFSCSPQGKEKSSTAIIAEAFKNGFESKEENKAEIYFLNERNLWYKYKKIYEENTDFLFAMPLYVECVPGILLEFLETLSIKKNTDKKAKMAFIVQGGFEEAHQLRTCEQYLETLPKYFNCEYGGTLIKGGMFGLAMSSSSNKEKVSKAFYNMGISFAEKGKFDKNEVTEFAKPEYYSKSKINLIKMCKPINKIAWIYLAKKFGAKKKLDYKPYKIE